MHRINNFLHISFLLYNFTIVLNVRAMQRCNSEDKDTPQAYCVKPLKFFLVLVFSSKVFLAAYQGMKSQILQISIMLRGFMIKTYYHFLLLT